jgi:hypothetical protein
MLRRVLAVFVLLQFTPMLAELTEWTVHYLSNEDFVHSAGHVDEQQDRQGSADEHGCTPALHSCACHAPNPLMTAQAVVGVRTAADGSRAQVKRPLRDTRDAEPPPLPPPIA